MTEHEWMELTATNNAAIIAPAGHGKTEMLAEIVNRSSGKLLLLTHTNAGVDAIKKRLINMNISSSRYNLETIASFCIKWCNSYCSTCDIDKNLSPLVKEQAKAYYAQFYTGALTLFSKIWIGNVLKATYTRIIVDEYQDCTMEQHYIMLQLFKHLPLIALGDPMQGIFSFAGPLVDWNNLEYPIVNIKTHPWRWEKTNRQLGSYLSDVRNALLPSLDGNQSCIDIVDSNFVCVIHPNNFNLFNLIPELNNYSSVVFITKWESKQMEICARYRGLFQYDEKQECPDLFNFAEEFDRNENCKLALLTLEFIKKCSAGITTELKSYIERLKSDSTDFSRISKHPEVGVLISALCSTGSKQSMYSLIKYFDDNDPFKLYRKELYCEMLRAIKYAYEHNLTIFESANHIRKDAHLQKRYSNFKYLSSRTLLAKGLEFDCIIVDMQEKLSAKEFYVAMTRAKKMIYIISSTHKLLFQK